MIFNSVDQNEVAKCDIKLKGVIQINSTARGWKDMSMVVELYNSKNKVRKLRKNQKKLKVNWRKSRTKCFREGKAGRVVARRKEILEKSLKELEEENQRLKKRKQNKILQFFFQSFSLTRIISWKMFIMVLFQIFSFLSKQIILVFFFI